MVRQAAASGAANYAHAHPALGVGLHLDFGEWALRDGGWTAIYEVADVADSKAVGAEIERQLDVFMTMMGRLPTHLDSHQHKHLREPVRSAVCEAAKLIGVPVRGISIPYCGRFYGQDETGASHPEWIGVPSMLDILRGLQDETTEIGCHPAADADISTMYAQERILELATLCDPSLRHAIAELWLTPLSFATLHS
jgi:predicted glycoside hydrolase/deacetylase ChbG (UPF0249 family)